MLMADRTFKVERMQANLINSEDIAKSRPGLIRLCKEKHGITGRNATTHHSLRPYPKTSCRGSTISWLICPSAVRYRSGRYTWGSGKTSGSWRMALEDATLGRGAGISDIQCRPKIRKNCSPGRNVIAFVLVVNLHDVIAPLFNTVSIVCGVAGRKVTIGSSRSPSHHLQYHSLNISKTLVITKGSWIIKSLSR